MSKVFVTTYEIIGEGIPFAEAYYAEIAAALSAHWAFTEEVGGVGLRPSSAGGLRSVFFEGDVPTGWRQIAVDGNRIECLPRKSTKAGKALLERICALPFAPRASQLTGQLGWRPPHFPTDGGKIYFDTECSVSFPAQRYFIRLPRFSEDGFEPDSRNLRALPESEFMKAIEDHNAEARRLREAGE